MIGHIVTVFGCRELQFFLQEFKGARRGIRARAYRNSKVRVEGFEHARTGGVR